MSRVWFGALLFALVLCFGLPAHAQIGPQATCPASLLVGEVFDCSINGTGEIDSYSFSAQQNDTWYFRVKRTAGTLQPWIRVLSAGDVQVCGNYTFGDLITISCNITSSGSYTFKVADNTSTSGRTGPYIVYGQRVNSPANATPVAFGSQTNATMQYVIEDNVYRFDATINDRLNIRVRRSVGTMQPWMYVFDSAGNQLCGSYTFADYVGLDCAVTKTDTYYIFITDLSSDATGSYTLHLQRRNNPGGAAALAYGVPTNGNILVQSAMNAYTFTAKANDQVFLRIKANSGNMQPAVSVYSQSGEVVCGNYTFGTFLSFNCSITSDGTYNVIVDENGVDGTGDYTLYLQRTRNPGNATQLTYGKIQNGALDAIGAFGSYTFVAGKNDKINLSFARSAGTMTFNVGVYDPNGEQICATYGFSNVLQLNNCAITTDGVHSLFVFDVGDDAVGTYTLTLTCPTGICGAPATRSRLFLPLLRR
jgi:hypothetical protein